jgi:hypothetical protein
MTSQDIYDKLNRHFDPVTRDHMINEWALIEGQQMAAALGWMVADLVLNIASILDITGITDVIAAYAKPKCLEVSEYQRLPARRDL